MSLAAVWLWMYLAWVALEIAISIGMRSRSDRANVQDRGSQLGLWLVIVLSFTASGFLRHHDLAPMHMAWTWLTPVCIALFAMGLVVRIAAILTLGKWFTANVATQAGQTIQRRGLYSVVRHPSYLGMEILFFAIGLFSNDWLCLALSFVPPTLAVLYRIHVEEAALLAAFGPEYADYARTTRRLVPKIY
jgi:protein-S-isoprenylcysteine O-methyltransferase Ste14